MNGAAAHSAPGRRSIYARPAGVQTSEYIPNDELQLTLHRALVGRSLAGLPLRTRSKVAKSMVCEALGYEVPDSFQRTQPRFPHQNFDLYVQKSNNLQVWNEELDPGRRYVVLGLDASDEIVGVRVLSGQELALLDTTGTVTSKYQASRIADRGSLLVNYVDTPNFAENLRPVGALSAFARNRQSPVASPRAGEVLSIRSVFDRLLVLEGVELVDPGATQERLRGVALQREVCRILELGEYADGGQFPDVTSQALEVKLQLARTIDLGLVSPDSNSIAQELGPNIMHSDVRYAIAHAQRTSEISFRISSIVVTSGAFFFDEFRRFEGRVQNRKLQIRLPVDLFW